MKFSELPPYAATVVFAGARRQIQLTGPPAVVKGRAYFREIPLEGCDGCGMIDTEHVLGCTHEQCPVCHARLCECPHRKALYATATWSVGDLEGQPC